MWPLRRYDAEEYDLASCWAWWKLRCGRPGLVQHHKSPLHPPTSMPGPGAETVGCACAWPGAGWTWGRRRTPEVMLAEMAACAKRWHGQAGGAGRGFLGRWRLALLA